MTTESTVDESPLADPKMKLVLHVEVPGIYVDDLPGYVAEGMETEELTPKDYANALVGDWIRGEVGLTLVTVPGELCAADDFEVRALTGKVVGMEVTDV